MRVSRWKAGCCLAMTFVAELRRIAFCDEGGQLKPVVADVCREDGCRRPRYEKDACV